MPRLRRLAFSQRRSFLEITYPGPSPGPAALFSHRIRMADIGEDREKETATPHPTRQFEVLRRARVGKDKKGSAPL